MIEEPPGFSSDTFTERPLPRSEEAEKIVLGSVILDNAIADKLIGRIVPGEFSNLFHNHLFTTYVSLRNKSLPIDPVHIIDEMKKLSIPEGFHSIARIGDLIRGLPHITSLDNYITVIKDKALSRQLIKDFNLLAMEISSEEKTGEEYLELAQEKVFSLGVNRERRGFKTASDIVAMSLERAQTVAQTGNTITGLSTGFVDIDNATLGLQPEDLIIVAARPSMGKTALSLTFGLHAAIREHRHVAVFSLEMGDISIADRLICSEAEIDSMKYRSGSLSPQEWQKVHDATARIMNAKMSIDDTPGIGIAEMKYKLRNEVAERGPVDLIIVDYIQLMSGDGSKKSENRQQEVSTISRELKQIARSFHAPTLVLSQLSRAPETRGKNHRPVLSDLRESGAIEQDADVVGFIYRESVYADPNDINNTTDETRAEFIIAKQRNGPTVSIDLYFNKQATKFLNAEVAEF